MSFSAAQVSRFAAKVVAATAEAFPTAVRFRGVDITLKSTTIKTAEQLTDGGFLGIYDCVMRLPVATLLSLPADKRGMPIKGETLIHNITATKLRIEKVDLPGVAPEYVLHLMKA